jgi:hypothetical protein
LPEGAEEKQHKLRITGVPAKIEAEHLLNASLGRYC